MMSTSASADFSKYLLRLDQPAFFSCFDSDDTAVPLSVAATSAATAVAPSTTASTAQTLPATRNSSSSVRRRSSASLLNGANNSFEPLRRVLSGAPLLLPSASGAHLYVSDFDFSPECIGADDAVDELARLGSSLSLSESFFGVRGQSDFDSIGALLSEGGGSHSAAAAAAASYSARDEDSVPDLTATATAAHSLCSSESLAKAWLPKTLSSASASASATASAATPSVRPMWTVGDTADDMMDVQPDGERSAAAYASSAPTLSTAHYHAHTYTQQQQQQQFFLLDQSLEQIFDEGNNSNNTLPSPSPLPPVVFLDTDEGPSLGDYCQSLPTTSTMSSPHTLPAAPAHMMAASPSPTHIAAAAAAASPSAVAARVADATTATSGVRARKPVRETKRQREARLKKLNERHGELKRNLDVARDVVEETLRLVYLVWKERQLI